MLDIKNRWMEAHLRRWQDGQIYIGGRDSDPTAVADTIYFTMSVLGLGADFAIDPTREEIVEWVKTNYSNADEEISYMMKEY